MINSFLCLKRRKSSPNFTKKKRTPKKSPVKSPKKSPAKLSSQRNLHPSFQNLKGPEVIETLALPSPSQIDPAVFAVLPEEVKKDIEISYQQRNQKFQMRALEKVFESGYIDLICSCV